MAGPPLLSGCLLLEAPLPHACGKQDSNLLSPKPPGLQPPPPLPRWRSPITAYAHAVPPILIPERLEAPLLTHHLAVQRRSDERCRRQHPAGSADHTETHLC